MILPPDSITEITSPGVLLVAPATSTVISCVGEVPPVKVPDTVKVSPAVYPTPPWFTTTCVTCPRLFLVTSTVHPLPVPPVVAKSEYVAASSDVNDRLGVAVCNAGALIVICVALSTLTTVGSTGILPLAFSEITSPILIPVVDVRVTTALPLFNVAVSGPVTSGALSGVETDVTPVTTPSTCLMLSPAETHPEAIVWVNDTVCTYFAVTGIVNGCVKSDEETLSISSIAYPLPDPLIVIVSTAPRLLIVYAKSSAGFPYGGRTLSTIGPAVVGWDDSVIVVASSTLATVVPAASIPEPETFSTRSSIFIPVVSGTVTWNKFWVVNTMFAVPPPNGTISKVICVALSMLWIVDTGSRDPVSPALEAAYMPTCNAEVSEIVNDALPIESVVV